MKSYLKKYSIITAALLMFVSLNGLTAFADETEKAVYDKTVSETSDIPQKEDKVSVSSPFENITDIDRLPLAGDLDNDGNVSSYDALLVLRAAVGLNNYSDRYFAGDVDGDNTLTSADSLAILRNSVGLAQKFANESLDNIKWYKDAEGYYAETADGSPLNGIVIIDGYKCGFDVNGKLLTGTAFIDGKQYDFLENGILPDNWQYTEKGKSYYQDGTKLDGWNTIYGLDYYFKDGYAVTGWNEIGTVKAYFDETGIASKGWNKIEGKNFYFGTDHGVQKGLVTIYGRKYFLYEDGDFALGWNKIDEKNYYFTKAGAAALGLTEIDGKTYFFIDENTLAKGLFENSGLLYYFDDENVMQTGWQIVNEKKYYFKENGRSVVGKYKIDDIIYEFYSDGVLKNGWVDSNKYKIFIDHNEIVKGEYNIDGVKYNFNKNGYLVTGLYKKGNTNYYNDEFGYPSSGWQDIEGITYYFNADSSGADGLTQVDDNWYFFENGKLKIIEVFSQRDTRWSDHPYGYYNTYGTERATIWSSGCGILSYVNAIYYLTGNFIEPTMLADYSVANGHRINGLGTAFTLYGAFASQYGAQYGFKYVGQVYNYTDLKNHLMKGGTAVASAPGHLMAVVDYNPVTEEFLILDSASSEQRHTQDAGYTWQTVSGIINTPKLNYSTFMLFLSVKA